MSEQPTAVLSALEAARRIYNTRSPTADQVGRTVEKIELGHLARSPKGGLTTTVEAVAHYLARRAAQRTGSGSAWNPILEPQAGAAAAGSMTGFYRELLKDYFLAVVMRRRFAHHSQAFQRAVVGSQAALLVAVTALVCWVSATAVRSRLVPPEHRAVQSWIADKHADAKIHEICKLERPPGCYRVNFQYGSGGRLIQSSLIFTVDGPNVVDVNSEL